MQLFLARNIIWFVMYNFSPPYASLLIKITIAFVYKKTFTVGKNYREGLLFIFACISLNMLIHIVEAYYLILHPIFISRRHLGASVSSAQYSSIAAIKSSFTYINDVT